MGFWIGPQSQMIRSGTLALGFGLWAWNRLRAGRSEEIIRTIPSTAPKFWLTIDDGPVRGQTEGMLEVLQSYGARASFFGLGREVEKRRLLSRCLVEAGHTLENHSYAHRSALHWLQPERCLQQEIARGSHAIRVATGQGPQFFRAPAGLWSRAMLRAVKAQGLMPVGWSAGGGEGSCCGDLLAAVDRTVAALQPGAIVLLHQGGRAGRVDALRLFLERSQRLGWSLFEPQEVRGILRSQAS
jgi:peptidoglycan-N-acetylglucosamine deacetylase